MKWFVGIPVGGLLCLMLAQSAFAWRIESGIVTTEDTSVTPVFTVITFQNPFDTVPIVVVTPTDEGDDPSDLRIRNVTTTGFEVAPLEPSGVDGLHTSMNVHYVAVEPGVLDFPDGTQIAAGFHNTSTQQAKNFVGVPTGWDTVNFGTTLSASANVVASIQTMNSEENAVPGTFSQPFLSMAIRNPTSSNVEMALERSEAAPGTVTTETIGWIAFPDTVSGSFVDIGSNTISWESRNTGDNVRGWNNGCSFHTYSTLTWANPVVVGTKNSRDGGDGGWARQCGISGNQVGFVIDEDTSNDNERNHTTEIVGMVAFSESFHAVFEAKINADKTVAQSVGDYALPGNEMRYTINAQSEGLLSPDIDTIVITDKIPDNVSLKVSDIGGAGSGPVMFTDGSPVSNLTYMFSGLADTLDDVSFSNDNGATFNYIPIPDGSGADGNVTHVRIHPKGTFQASNGTDLPEFSISFDVVID